MLEVQMAVAFARDSENIIYGFTVKTVDGITVYGANTRLREIETDTRRAGEVATVVFRLTLNLIPGDYFVSLGVAQDDASFDNLALDRRYDLFHLTVEGERRDVGVADLNLSFDEHLVTPGFERATGS
jgi:lipopolysaccharide transport system ATP-binding protein